MAFQKLRRREDGSGSEEGVVVTRIRKPLTELQKIKRRAREKNYCKANQEKNRLRMEARRRALGIQPRAPAMSEEEKRRRDRVRAEKYRRSKGVLPRPPKKTPEERYALVKAYYEANKAHLNELSRLRMMRKREAEKLAKGIPAEPPVKLTKEEVAARKAEAQRIKYRRERGLPDDYVFPHSPARKAKNGDAIQSKSRGAGKKETRLSLERAKRSAEVAAAMARQAPAPEPIVCPDPPELQALFKKASKGEPARPHNPYVKKRSAYQIRGWI